MAAPTFQAAGTAVSGINGVTVVWPTHQADDVGLLLIETRTPDAAPAAPTGWTQPPDSPQASTGGAGNSRLSIFLRRAAGSAEADVVLPDMGDHQIAQILTFRGCIATGDPWDVTAGDTENTNVTSVSIPGDTTTVADCLIVAASSSGEDTTTAQFSGWANADLTDVLERTDVFTTAGNGGGFGVATGVKATAGAYGATTATLATASQQGRISIALKPPASGDTVSPGLIDSSGAIFAPQVDQQVQAALVDQSGAVFAPTIDQAAVVGLIDQSGAVFAPVVTAPQTVTVPLIDHSGLVFSPSVAAEAAEGRLVRKRWHRPFTSH